MININRGCITYRLQDYYRVIGWKLPFSPTLLL